MNEDEMQALEVSAGDELERMLARYARVRLDPSPAQTRRARATLVEQAWRRHIALVDVPAPRVGIARFRRLPFATWRPRRLTLSLAAAVLAGLLVGSTAFATSRAGGPLYEVRLNVESLLLPSDPSARLDAQLAQAQARLADIVDASGRGDTGAMTAAVAAYDEAITNLSSTNAQGIERARAAIELHLSVLEQLLAAASGPSASGLQNAMLHSSGVIDRFDAATHPGPADGSTNAGGANADHNGNGDNNGNGGGGAPGLNGGANGGANGGGGTNGNSDNSGTGTSGSNDNNGNGGARPSSAPGQQDRTQPPAKNGAPTQAPEKGPGGG